MNNCTWTVSLDGGVTHGTNAPNFNNGATHMARRENATFDDGDVDVVFATSLDTTDGKDGTIYDVPFPDSGLAVTIWTVTDNVAVEGSETFRVHIDTQNPPTVTVKTYTNSGKAVELSDGDWINEAQLFFEFEWSEERSGIEDFSYSISGLDPDTTLEKTYVDPTYDMSSDPDPSNQLLVLRGQL